MEKVVVIRCPEYDEAVLREGMETAFSYFGGIGKILHPGEKVLLKPNLLIKATPDSGVITHPLLVKAAADMVRKAGALPSVGDSPAFGTVLQVAQVSGLLALLERNGIPIVLFKRNRRFNRSPRITCTVKDFDRIVNLPKLKAHSQMVFTCALKNLYGLVAGKVKAWRHFTARSDHEKFSLMILHIYKQVRPCFTIVDAIDIMEKTGPRHGIIRRAGLLFAGINCVSIDRIVCEVFCIDPDRIPLLSAARKCGYSGCRLNDIQVLGSNISELRTSDYLFPTQVDDISFSLPRVIRGVLRHTREKLS